ncbi:MAG: hypothetical protein HY049_01930 [Acidobacteria bacterium]|nr:hypothetical protein [Acidobacteriota bacterium]
MRPPPRAIRSLLPVVLVLAALPAASPALAAPTVFREVFHRPAHAQAGAPVMFEVSDLATPVHVFFTKASGGTVEATPVTVDLVRGLVITHVPATAGDGDVVVRANGVDSTGFYFRVDFSPFAQGSDTVTGTVKIGSGSAVSGALVVLLEDACGEFVLRDFTGTDPNGRYTLHSRAGSHLVLTFPPNTAGLASGSAPVTTSPTPATANIVLEAGTLVTGTVLDSANAPVGGTRITFDLESGSGHEEAVADPSGDYSVRLAGGLWTFTMSPPVGDTTHAFLSTQVLVFGSSLPVGGLKLAKGVPISGTFTRALDGTPMAGAEVFSVTTSPCCPDNDRKTTAGDGSFSIIAPMNSTSTLNADLDPEVALIGPTVMDVAVASVGITQDLTAEEAVTISGTLADKSAKGLRDVTVLATHAAGLFATAATSCPDGTYKLHVLPDPNGFFIKTGPPNPRTTAPVMTFKSWTNDPNGTFFPCEADPVPATSPSTPMTGVDFILGLAAKAKGRVSTQTASCTDDLGTFGLMVDDGVDHACSLGDLDPNSLFGGGFTLIGLPSTSDLPSLRACSMLPGFDAQCYNMKTFPDFDPITIPPGGVKTGLDLCVAPCTPTTWFQDLDGDHHGDPGSTQFECNQPPGYAAVGDDCNDADPNIHPGAAEICNDVDDDCDGNVDNFTSHCGAGACASTGTCAAGVDSCVAGTPTAEVCNGVDDNCNGQVDEGNPGGGAACATGQPGVCGPGMQTCTGGALMCVRTTNPSPEVCDNLDNNCDGTVDGFATACGSGACASTGTCVAGADSCMALTPQTEVCNGIDDDCDGMTDEGNPGGGAPCATGLMGVCSPGTETCTNGSLQCAALMTPTAEVCDNLDNDCDGTVDGFATSCGMGRCAAAGSCVAGSDTCAAGAPGTEVCDGVDDDCDGQVDDVSGGCTLFVAGPLPGEPLDCTSPLTSQPTITWNVDRYDKFKVFISTMPTFPSSARVTSGSALIVTGSWHVKAKAWNSICKKAVNGGSLFIRIQGIDNLAPRTDPLKKFISPVTVAAVVK